MKVVYELILEEGDQRDDQSSAILGFKNNFHQVLYWQNLGFTHMQSVSEKLRKACNTLLMNVIGWPKNIQSIP